MTTERLMELREKLDKICGEILEAKGNAYICNSDRLSNFKAVSNMLGICPLAVWEVYFLKHLFAVNNYIRDGKEGPEGIESNIADLRNYIDLLYAIVNEREELPF